jgi:hypothetical protein
MIKRYTRGNKKMIILLYVAISILVGIGLDLTGLITESDVFISGIFGLLLYIAVQISKKEDK